jgi:hypothetical protein
MKKKFYQFIIEERHGEQEYSYTMGCYSSTENGAIRKARRYAKRFYDIYDNKPKEISENVFLFGELGIEVEMNFCGEVNFDDFKARLVECALI